MYIKKLINIVIVHQFIIMSSSESESEYETNDHHSDHENIQQVTEPASKSPKPKMSFNDSLENHDSMLLETGELFNELSELDKDYEKNRKELCTRLRKNLKKLRADSSKFTKSFESELKGAKKKKKGSGNSTGGFNKPVPIPKKLVSYLDLDDSELSRPAVAKLLNARFKEREFRDGKTVTISQSKDAKALGVKKGHVIEFSQFQTFLAKFYNEESKPSTANA